MAKKATAKGAGGKSTSGARRNAKSAGPAKRRKLGGSKPAADPAEMFVKLLQSPFIAEIVAVAATAALASLAEHGFTSSSSSSRGKRAGKAVKQAGKAAAAAVGRRLSTELDEIRSAATASKSGAKG